MLDRGGTVVVLEKQGHRGGNSAWASSGVNAVDASNTKGGDSVAAFTVDTLCVTERERERDRQTERESGKERESV